MYSVVKRDGQIVDFDVTKISSAITKAFEALHKNYHPKHHQYAGSAVTADFDSKIKDDLISVGSAQDSVEKSVDSAMLHSVLPGLYPVSEAAGTDPERQFFPF